MNFRKLTILVVVVFIIGLAAGGFLYHTYSAENLAEPEENEVQESAPEISGPFNVAPMVEEVSPAVVKIETLIELPQGEDPFFNDPFFRDFFGRQYEVPRYDEGLGSGVIISTEGYILTNQHVIENADQVAVVMKDREEPIEAEVVGQDAQLDLAVLKIPGDDDLPTLELGSSKDVSVGDWVVAIGNPYGLDHTVTVGVISATGRPLTIEGQAFKNLLQTDASINPGNSGGPLLNLEGEVIGINTAIDARALGIGFAIPTETIMEVLDELIEEGGVTRPWLGVVIQDVTPDFQAYLGLDSENGAIIAHVEPGSPADSAGLRDGDVIQEFDGEVVANAERLVDFIRDSETGEEIEMLIFRQGSTQELTVTIGQN